MDMVAKTTQPEPGQWPVGDVLWFDCVPPKNMLKY